MVVVRYTVSTNVQPEYVAQYLADGWEVVESERTNVHDHGPEEGKGLACREYRASNGQLRGECIARLWTCKCGWTNLSDDKSCLRCFLHESA